MKKFILVLGIIVSMMLVSMAGATFTTWKGVDYSDHSITMNAGTTLTAPTLAVTALTGTNGYYTGTLKAAGATALNVTNVTRISASGTAYLNATRATTLVASGNTYLNYTALTDVRASDDGYITDTLGVGGTSALNYTTVTDLRASDDGYITDTLGVGGTSALNYTTVTDLRASDDGYITDTLGVGGTSALNYTTVTDLRASDDIYAPHLLALLSNMNATTMTTGYVSSGLNVAGTSGLNTTTATVLTVSNDIKVNDEIGVAGHSHLNVTNATTLSTSGKGTLANLDVTGNTFLNGTTVGSGDTLAVTDADRLTVNSVIVPQEMIINVPVTNMSTNNTIFIANNAWQVTKIESSLTTATTVYNPFPKCTIVKLTGAEVPSGNHTTLLENSTRRIDLKGGSLGTPATATLNSTVGSLQLADGNRLGIKFNSTLESVVALITIHMKRI
jgi:hypothetical protein